MMFFLTNQDHLQDKNNELLKWILKDYAVENGILLPLMELGQAELSKNDHGKPYFALLTEHAGQGWPSLHFSVSHSGPWWACAVDLRPVGFDIEYPARHERFGTEQGQQRLLAIARRFFTEEENEFLLKNKDNFDAFFSIWVKKEAYLKYLGTGISRGLSSFSVIRKYDFLESIQDRQGNVAYVRSINLTQDLIVACCSGYQSNQFLHRLNNVGSIMRWKMEDKSEHAV